MTPDEHTHHGGHEHEHEPDPTHGAVVDDEEKSPDPLLKNATATIYFDGLIYMAYNEDQRLYQCAALTQAEGHELRIEVRERGKEDLLFPVNKTDWDPKHATVKERAPFWLFVDSGNGIQPDDFSATLHLTDKQDPQSFKNIFNFEVEYDHPIFPKPEAFAEFNFPHGISYSARITEATVKTLLPDQEVKDAVKKGDIKVSTLAGIDIDAVSDDSATKRIVLANEGGKNKFFEFDLEPGKQYEIQILNVPIKGEHTEHDPQQHFRQFYELFDLEKGEKQFLVGPLEAAAAAGAGETSVAGETPGADAPTTLSPPCVSTTGDTKSGLGGGS